MFAKTFLSCSLSAAIAIAAQAQTTTSDAQPPETQPPMKGQVKSVKVAAPKSSRQVFRAKSSGVPAKQRIDTPASSITLKPGEVPKIRFDTPIYDFGRVRATGDVQHDYWFTNIGTGPLEIISIRPSCGCTSSGEYDKIVQPGQSGKIPIKVNTHGPGPLTKTITIQTNAPDADSSTVLTIKGELWQVVEATPPNIMYGSMRGSGLKDDQLIRKVTIKNNDTAPLKVTTPVSSSPVFGTELKETEAGKTYELIITAKQPMPMGNTSGSITVNTSAADMPVLNIPVSIYVTADVEATPSQIILPLSIPKPMQRLVYVRNYSDKPMKITDVSVGNDEIKSQLTEPQAGVAFRITLDFPRNMKIRAGGEKLTIKTDNSAIPVLTIPILQAGSLNSTPTAKIDTSNHLPIAASAAPTLANKESGQQKPRN